MWDFLSQIERKNTKEIWKETNNFHLLEFRCDHKIPMRYEKRDKMFKMIENNTKIRDLELIVSYNKDLLQVLQIVKHNYMIKTCILSWEEDIEQEAIQIAIEIKQNRIGMELILKEGDDIVWPKKIPPFVIYYPA